jgi:X-X-X-Leu-X-X-Gly heptad repeat protein
MKKSLLALAIILCTSTYAQYTVVFGKNDNIKFVESEITEPETPVEPEVPEEPEEPVKNNASCKTLLDETPSLSNGIYQLKSGSGELAAYCDMSAGGWTLVASGVRYNTTGWNTSGAFNLTTNPNTAISFKYADGFINGLPKNTYRVISTGRYSNTRYFSGGCQYNHTATANGACLISFANEGLNAGAKQGVAYGEVTGLSDFNAAAGTLYVITGYSGSIAIHGWGMGNGVNSGYSGTGTAGDGGNIQIWVK